MILKKLTSRKFLAAVAGFVGGIILICNGNANQGASALIVSVVGYLAAEGYIDAKAVAIGTAEIASQEEQEENDSDYYGGCTE